MNKIKIEEERTYHPNNQVPHRTDELEARQTSNTPKNDLHVDQGALALRGVFAIAGRGCVVESFETGSAQDHGTQSEVTEDPGEHDSTTESLVVVCLLFFLGDNLDLLRGLHGELGELGFVLGIKVTIVLGDVNVDLATGLEVGRGQFLGLVISFGTPGDIVGVTEGVDIEDVDVGWREQDILDELDMLVKVKRNGRVHIHR